MAKKYNICLDIGGTKVLGAVFNEKDKLVCKIKKRSSLRLVIRALKHLILI